MNQFRAQKVNQYRKNGSLVYVYRLLPNQDADAFRNAIASAPLSKNGRPTALSIECNETGLPLYFYTSNNPLDYTEAGQVTLQVSNQGRFSIKEVLEGRNAREKSAHEKVEMLNALGTAFNLTKEQVFALAFGQNIAPTMQSAPQQSAPVSDNAPIDLEDSI